MNAGNDLERRLADHYATEVPQRAPDWVLGTVLATIDTTRQRRALIRVPWRIPTMNTYLKWAIAAVVVVAVGAFGLALLRPASEPSVGGLPTARPSASPSPSPSPSTDASTPPLSSTFTSTMHGFSISYPMGWESSSATEPVTAPGLSYPSPDMDWIYDAELTSDLFLGLGSQPLGDKAPETWVTDFLDSFDGGCGARRVPISVDGTNGVICDGQLFATAVGGRGYYIRSYTGDRIPAELAPLYDETWFRNVLATMRFSPADAVDTVPSPST